MRPARAAIRTTLLALAAAATLAGCARGTSGDSTTAETPRVRVTGRIVDAETGDPVPRTDTYVHAFDDATGHQVSLRPEDDAEFELEMPAPEIRLRISDRTNTYELFEQDFVARDGVLDVTARLQPTHRIRLHGTVLWRDADGSLRPVAEGDGGVRDIQLSAGSGVIFRTDADGTYSVKAPRALLEIRSVDTNYEHSPREVDLRGQSGDEYELDIVLTPPR